MTDRRENEDNVLRRFFKNELTWVGTVVVVFWQIIVQIVIPLNIMQVQLAQINASIATLQGLNAQITKNSNDIIRLIADDPKFKR